LLYLFSFSPRTSSNLFGAFLAVVGAILILTTQDGCVSTTVIKMRHQSDKRGKGQQCTDKKENQIFFIYKKIQMRKICFSFLSVWHGPTQGERKLLKLSVT
jgi:hypothetical protein